MSAPSSRSARRQRRDVPDDADSGAPVTKPSRAGRDLPAAIAVGVGLGILIVGSLLLLKELMLVIVVAAVAVGVWELRRALLQVSIAVPLVPSVVGSVSMILSAYIGGGEALVLTLGL